MEHTMTVTHHRGGRTKEETQELYEVLKACNTKKPNPEKVDALRVVRHKKSPGGLPGRLLQSG